MPGSFCPSILQLWERAGCVRETDAADGQDYTGCRSIWSARLGSISATMRRASFGAKDFCGFGTSMGGKQREIQISMLNWPQSSGGCKLARIIRAHLHAKQCNQVRKKRFARSKRPSYLQMSSLLSPFERLASSPPRPRGGAAEFKLGKQASGLLMAHWSIKGLGAEGERE